MRSIYVGHIHKQAHTRTARAQPKHSIQLVSFIYSSLYELCIVRRTYKRVWTASPYINVQSTPLHATYTKWDMTQKGRRKQNRAKWQQQKSKNKKNADENERCLTFIFSPCYIISVLWKSLHVLRKLWYDFRVFVGVCVYIFLSPYIEASKTEKKNEMYRIMNCTQWHWCNNRIGQRIFSINLSCTNAMWTKTNCYEWREKNRTTANKQTL